MFRNRYIIILSGGTGVAAGRLIVYSEQLQCTVSSVRAVPLNILPLKNVRAETPD